MKVPFSRIVLINSAKENGGDKTGVMYPWLVTNDLKPMAPKPFMFFNVRKTVGAGEEITLSSISTFNMMSNVSEDENHSLSFGNAQNDTGGILNKNGLFNRFYQQYIVQAFELKSRIIKVKAILPLSILLN